MTEWLLYAVGGGCGAEDGVRYGLYLNNVRRFPASFMFQLTKEELEDLRSQIATSNNGATTKGTQLVILNREDWRSQNATSNLEQYAKMGVRNRPYAFTEHGIIMLASVLKSDNSCSI